MDNNEEESSKTEPEPKPQPKPQPTPKPITYNLTASLSKSSFVYNGKTKKPTVTVKGNGTKLKENVDYTVAYPKKSKDVGTYTITVTGKSANYKGKTAKVTFTITKANNTLQLKKAKKTPSVALKKLKKSNQYVELKKLMTVSKAIGKATYKLETVTKSKYKKYFSVNSKTGKVTVKKKLGKGTYTLKIKVTAAGNKNYKSMNKSLSVKIKVA